MEAYKRFVRLNKDFVISLESLANWITWFLPERFSNSEIGPEAVHSLLSIITSVNQHIIDTTTSHLAPWIHINHPFPWSLYVSALKDVEAVVEVAADHFFGDGKWNFMIFTESAKAAVRLALLRDSGYKMLLQGGELSNRGVREEPSEVKGRDPSEVKGSELAGYGVTNGYHGPHDAQGYFRVQGYDPRNMEGQALYALHKFGENAKLVSEPSWYHKSHPFIEIPATPVHKTSFLDFLSKKGTIERLFLTQEVLSILRPLIYVLLIRKFGVKSWIPWFLSLTVDLSGMGILNHIKNESGKGDFELSTCEIDEVKRRKHLLILYLMRDPFFSRYTRPHLQMTEKLLNRVPLLGLITGKVSGLIVGLQTRYTYTSGS